MLPVDHQTTPAYQEPAAFQDARRWSGPEQGPGGGYYGHQTLGPQEEDFFEDPMPIRHAGAPTKHGRFDVSGVGGTHQVFRVPKIRRGRGGREEDTPRPPIDKKNAFDVILSCGFGAKSYLLSDEFAVPAFRVRFARRIFCVLLVQFLLVDIWMALVLTSPSVEALYAGHHGITYAGIIAYALIYSLIRWSSCGSDGMCFMGLMIVTMLLTMALAMAAGGIATAFPSFVLIGFALWLSLFVLALAQLSPSVNILTEKIYAVAGAAGVGSSGLLLWLVAYSGQELIMEETGKDILGSGGAAYWTTAATVLIITPLLALLLVYEIKKLIGGRRTDLEQHQWILAAIVL